jgi:phosphopantothenoylcysteine decarboxylase/phosphopantothenate--cysteine ligase
MRAAVLDHLTEATVVIKAAAVADYRIASPAPQKIKKSAAPMTLELEPTIDILAEVGRMKGDRVLVGFAAETGNLEAEARRKLETKNCDMVVGNRVDVEGVGFGSDQNEIMLVLRTGEVVELPRASKRELADRVLDQVFKLRTVLHTTQ